MFGEQGSGKAKYKAMDSMPKQLHCCVRLLRLFQTLQVTLSFFVRRKHLTFPDEEQQHPTLFSLLQA